MSLRTRFLSRLETGVGLTGKAGPTREAYALHLGGPDEDRDVAVSMASYRDGTKFSSTCGLEMRADLRDAGYVDPKRISGKYRPRMGLVMSDLEAIAIEHGAKVVPGIGLIPRGGDIAAVAWKDPTHAHIFGIVRVDVIDADTLHLECVEGGQIDSALNQWTIRKLHTWKRSGTGWMDTSVALEPKGKTLEGGAPRPVSFWIDIDKLDVSPTPRGSAGPATLAPTAPTPAAPPITASPTPAPTARPHGLTVGSSGPEVVRWQGIVNVMGDGKFGPMTFEATKRWQAEHGLPVTGVVGQDSWTAALAKPVASPTPTAILEGIDISSIQGAIDWERVRAAGISFAYVRSVIGLDTRDSMRALNAARARKAGVELGMYGVCYPRHGRAQDAEKQGAQLAADHKASGATLRPMIDFESLTDVPNATDIEWSNALTAYIAGLSAAGLEPILYTYPSFWRGLGTVFAASRWAHYPLWIAHYTKAAQPDVPPPWTRALVWQYAASAPGFEGRVDGVPGLVDRNRLFGSLDDLRVQR